MRGLDFGLVDVEFWLCGRWILVGWMLDFGLMHVGFDLVNVGIWFCGRWILVVWMLDLGWVDVGPWLHGH